MLLCASASRGSDMERTQRGLSCIGYQQVRWLPLWWDETHDAVGAVSRALPLGVPSSVGHSLQRDGGNMLNNGAPLLSEKGGSVVCHEGDGWSKGPLLLTLFADGEEK
ncbi:unnamed protein product [Ostreobium quekettii]|uniref:Uncharacterized protein n=1 Tax=Ostreobium quekettii TaxID=121088 RepID=A0A8S1ITB2_9CHLO|nr:unnamed protein product [Ostreobium quekettii]